MAGVEWATYVDPIVELVVYQTEWQVVDASRYGSSRVRHVVVAPCGAVLFELEHPDDARRVGVVAALERHIFRLHSADNHKHVTIERLFRCRVKFNGILFEIDLDLF